MARRRRSGAADDLMDLVALLPWWAGVGLAVVLYLVLHAAATQPAPEIRPGQVGAGVAGIYLRTLAMVGQYVLPLLCLAGALVSALRRRRRAQLLDDATGNETADGLQGIGWQEFEQLVGEAFRLQGYRVTETGGGGGADGGVDLMLGKDGEKLLVQCKQWRAFKVGVSVVRELYGVMAAQGASGGFVITSGRFTDEAREFAQGRNVRLVDGPKLQAMLRQVRSARAAGGASGFEASMSGESKSPRTLVPSCPVCAKPMTRRVARKGSKAGEAFWGCTGFPGCRGTRTV